MADYKLEIHANRPNYVEIIYEYVIDQLLDGCK